MLDLTTHAALMGRRMRGAFFGMQAGVMGALAMILFMMIVSVSERNPWWVYPNVLATMVYGGRTLSIGPGWPTVAGMAVQVLFTGIAGAMFGAFAGGFKGGSRQLVLGIIWGLVWYYITDRFYRTYAQLIPVYAPEGPLLFAHALMGVVLGTAGRSRGTSPNHPAIG